MKNTPLAIAALALALTAAAPAAWAQGRNCADRERVVDRLNTHYGETRQSIGLGANNAVVEQWASDETGTWTITITMPNGVTCLVASGQAFETVVEQLTPSSEEL